MFDRLSKSGTAADDGGPGARLVGDLSGAFGDLGTFLPLVIGLLVLGRFDPTGMLIGFTLLLLGASGLIGRMPRLRGPLLDGLLRSPCCGMQPMNERCWVDYTTFPALE